MKGQLAKGVYVYLDDDNAFIEWCHDNPAGYFWNCGRDKQGNVLDVYTRHSALLNGKLCPHFRDSRRAGGYVVNLTTRAFCKVVSMNPKALEKWAGTYPGSVAKNCATCTGLS